MQIILLIIAGIVVLGLIGLVWDFIKSIIGIILLIVAVVLYIRFYKITIPITCVYLVYRLIKLMFAKLKEKGITIAKIIKTLVLFALFIAQIYLCIEFPKIGFSLFGIEIVGILIKGISNKKSTNRKIKRLDPVTSEEICKIIHATIDGIREINTPERRYYSDNMPWGRVNAFLNYFNRNANDEEVLYFRVISSDLWHEIREYGVVITDSAVYISVQKEKEENYVVHNYHIPYAGLLSIQEIDGRLEYKYLENRFKKEEKGYITEVLWGYEARIIEQFTRHIIEAGYPERLLYVPLERVKSGETISVKEINNSFIEGISKAGIQITTHELEKIWNENKRYMGAAQGHGYAAEYAENTIDRLLGKDVVNQAQQLVDGHQVKNGADRIVNGVEIQSKYCATGAKCVEECFDYYGDFRYYDKNGNPMKIEVPVDKYFEAISEMETRIEFGQIEGVSNPEEAKNIIKKGHFTYEQAHCIARAGTVEGLIIDALSGAIESAGIASLSTVMTFAHAVWNGEDVDKAMALGMRAGISILGKGAVINIITMQLTTRQKNCVNDFTESLSKAIRQSKLAKSTVGEALDLDTMTSQKLLGTTISVAITFGPDVCRFAQGKISQNQLLKNTVVTGAGIATSSVAANVLLGMGLESVFVGVGGMLAGGLASFVVKNMLDQYVEDDARTMFRFLKEEYLDVVMQIYLTEDEQAEVIANTIAHPSLDKILQQMYMSGEYRRFAREGIVQIAVTEVLSKREKITNEMMQRGLDGLVYES